MLQCSLLHGDTSIDFLSLDQIKQTFIARVTPEQRMLQDYIDKEGGSEKLISDIKLLQHFISNNKIARAAVDASGLSLRESGNQRDDMARLKAALAEFPDTSVENNAVQFRAKFQLMQENLKKDMELMLRGESDRVIGAMTAGPQDNLQDPVRTSCLAG